MSEDECTPPKPIKVRIPKTPRKLYKKRSDPIPDKESQMRQREMELNAEFMKENLEKVARILGRDYNTLVDQMEEIARRPTSKRAWPFNK